jgi:hypothetical protein
MRTLDRVLLALVVFLLTAILGTQLVVLQRLPKSIPTAGSYKAADDRAAARDAIPLVRIQGGDVDVSGHVDVSGYVDVGGEVAVTNEPLEVEVSNVVDVQRW